MDTQLHHPEDQPTDQKSQSNKSDSANGDYFSNLEAKLLKKSDKITNIIGFAIGNKITKQKGIPKKSPHKESLMSEKLSKYSPNTSTYSGRKVRKVSKSPFSKNMSSPTRKFSNRLHFEAMLQQLNERNCVYSQQILEQSNTHHDTPKEIKVVEPIKVVDPIKAAEPKVSEFKIQSTSKEMHMKKAYSIKFPNSQFTESVSTEGSLAGHTQYRFNMSIDDFIVMSYLGKGKFGDVYLARHKTINFCCAIKKIEKQLLDDKSLTQLCRELKIQSHLDHPNIVQLFKFFWDNNDIYLILEICHSGHLSDELKKSGSLSEARVKNIIRQVCKAVEYMHSRDVIHRDLKPQNILLHEGVVKICDFGWSVCSPLMRDTFCGTPLYVSPELLQKKKYDNKIDIWGIGILTYELFVGRVPFEIRYQEDLFKIVHMSNIQVYEEIYFPKDDQMSDSAKDFISQCLEKDPHKRPSINKLLDHGFVYESPKPLKNWRH